MKSKLGIFILYLFVSLSANAQNLCLSTEKTVISFSTKAKKILSLCAGTNNSYLAYRYGVVNRIELQFPSKLDASSWKKFEFYGVSRGGGKINAGFGDYSVVFENGTSQYTIYQQWSDEDNSYDIGVAISSDKGRQLTIKGLTQTQEGSLVLLGNERDKITNKAE
jgi:hypothetical protein